MKLFLLGLCGGLLAMGAAAQEPVSSQALAGKVARVSITNNEVAESRRWREVRRLMDQAIDAGTTALLLELNVTSGRASIALPFAEEVARLKVRTIAYVNPSAIAGGALMALACDEIWMAPGSRVGAAPPALDSDDKLSEAAQETLMAESLAVLKAGARSLCKLKGHRAEVGEAFIDKAEELKFGSRVVSAKGELLLLDADEAVEAIDGKPLLARGQVPDIPSLLKRAGLAGHAVTLSNALFEKPEPKVSKAKDRPGDGHRRAAGSYTGKVVIIPVGEEDLIARARFEFMSRTLERCTAEGAEAVIFDLDTPGGLAWDTTNLMMKDLQKLKPRSFAFVNPRALSAGAMIAVATDEIYMAPASSAGAATPVYSGGMEMGEAERAKMNSAIMSMARTVAKEKGRDPRVIEAMIDMDRGLTINGEVLCAKGEILTLDAEQATMLVDGKPLFAKAIVKSIDEIKKAEGLKGETVTAEPTTFERIAIWVTKYAAILILIGVAGGYLEMQTPGFGIPGFCSLAAFGLFFFGHYVAGSLVGQEALVMTGIFLLGVVLIVLELFIFPGAMIPGIAGFICIMIALVYTMSGWDAGSGVAPVTAPEAEGAGRTISFSFATYAAGLRNFAIGVVGAMVVIFALGRYLPKTRPFQRLVLASAAGGTLDTTPAMQTAASVHPGDVGITRSALRPYGTIEVAQRRMEAMVEGGYLNSGIQVRVREVRGPRVIVEAV